MPKIQTKKELAVAFIDSIRNMDHAVLNDLISRESGKELSQFLVLYAATVIANNPDKAIETTSTLMLLGYLIRANEEQKSTLTAPYGNA